MAFGTVLPEFVLVNIFMAIGTIGCFNAFEFLEFLPVAGSGFMTIGAGYLFVFPGQFKVCFLMVEF